MDISKADSLHKIVEKYYNQEWELQINIEKQLVFNSDLFKRKYRDTIISEGKCSIREFEFMLLCVSAKLHAERTRNFSQF